jgi:hypothetical protein
VGRAIPGEIPRISIRTTTARRSPGGHGCFSDKDQRPGGLSPPGRICEWRNRANSPDRQTTRIEAFSDGVIAIAITLLVLEVRVPHVEEGESLWDALRGLWPSYVGFGLSFVIIGIIWANHHEMFDFITRANRTLVLLNLLFLLCVGFLPFPTALLAEYLGREGERAAVNVYSGSARPATSLPSCCRSFRPGQASSCWPCWPSPTSCRRAGWSAEAIRPAQGHPTSSRRCQLHCTGSLRQPKVLTRRGAPCILG